VRVERERRAERWLVISYWANVEGMACSFHVDDRIPHLQAAGLEVEVLTSPCGPRPPGWGDRWHRVPSLSPSGLRFEVRHLANSFPKWAHGVGKWLLLLPILPFYAVEKLLLNLESTFWWWVSGGLAGLWWTRRRRFDLIYSSGGAISAHWAAAWVARRRGLPWIAEIRDPLPYQAEGRGRIYRRVLARTERLVHERADGVVYLTQTACQRAQERTRGKAACKVIYAGAERVGLPSGARDGNHLHLLHAGSLAGSRNPGQLLNALAELAARRPELRARIRLTLLGSTDRASRRMAAEFPYPEMVEVVAKVPRQAALARMAKTDALVVIQNTDAISEETIPSKVYDYLMSGRPVLSLLYRNPELAAMLREAGHCAVESADGEAIAAAIEQLCGRWEAGELEARSDTRYTRAGATAELVAWGRELVAARRARAKGEREAADE